MASGNDPPQLPRGLIGRTGAPSGKGARLPSIRGPRDLTLGGVQKKVFVPTIPARRTKQNENKSSDSASSSTKPNENQSKKPGGSGRGRDSGDRGRGRGRGRGRMSSNVIQTHSLFEQGPTEKLHKPTGGSEYSYGGGGGGGGGRGGSSSSPSKKFIKKERTDEETKEVLDNLLRDDFIAGDLEEEDVTLMPVKLPLEFKAEAEVKTEDYTKVKIKSEPMETDDVTDSVKVETDKKEQTLKSKPTERLVSCSELFTNPVKSEEGQLLYFQLPDMLPGLPVTTDEDFKKKKAPDKTTDDSAESDLNKKLSGCNLDSFSDGQIGKLIVRKSGRVQLLLGSSYLDVNMGTPCGFLQDVASVRCNGTQGDISILGHIDHRLVCTPDFEMLLDSS